MNIHVELGEQVSSLMWRIRSLGKKVGLAINPPTSIKHVFPYLEKIDELLIMTVNPGFGGQSFIHETVPKIQQVFEWRRSRTEVPYRCRRWNRLYDRRGVRACGAQTHLSAAQRFFAAKPGAAVKKMKKIVEKAGANTSRSGPRRSHV